jgi:hypothetical protein
MPTFEKFFDVTVCGLGTAGSLAALFSAENGLSVLGIEAFTCVGGTHTVGGIGGHYFGCPGGRYEQLDSEVDCFAQRYTCTKPESRKFLAEQKGRIAYLPYEEEADALSSFVTALYPLGAERDVLYQAQSLFRILREADKENYDAIYAPLPPTDGLGMALYNRMIRAAAHQIIEL